MSPRSLNGVSTESGPDRPSAANTSRSGRPQARLRRCRHTTTRSQDEALERLSWGDGLNSAAGRGDARWLVRDRRALRSGTVQPEKVNTDAQYPRRTDDDTVTIVVPRRAAEDFYYAISLAIGGRGGFTGYPEWAPRKKGGMPMKYGRPNGPKGKG